MHTVRGVYDIFGDQYYKHLHIERTAIDFFGNCNFQPVQLPIVEFTDVFKRSLGKDSDIVYKEMYSFEDRSNNSLTLRPEFTASFVRFIASNSLFHNLPSSFVTIGPVFRYERPQKCRQRQFNQINCEMIGFDSYTADVELIVSAYNFCTLLGINNKFKLQINSIGGTDDRLRYRASLHSYLEKHYESLSKDSQHRFHNNPLRILDSKDTNDQNILSDAPDILDYLSSESRNFFDKIQNSLTKCNIEFTINNKLVRGLDYYTHTVFEFVTDLLGAQSAILAGGRYNDLYRLMSNKDIPALGFAAGVERLESLCTFDDKVIKATKQTIILIMGEEYYADGLKISSELRSNGIFNKICIGHNLTKILHRANKDNIDIVIIIGENEIKNNAVIIKNMNNGNSYDCSMDNILDSIKKDL